MVRYFVFWGGLVFVLFGGIGIGREERYSYLVSVLGRLDGLRFYLGFFRVNLFDIIFSWNI